MPIEDIAVADAVIAAVVLISAVFGLMRGLVKEVLALVIWVGAAFLGMTLGPTLAAWVDLALSTRLRNAIGFGAVFVVVLVFGAFLQRFVHGLVRSTGLSGTDRTLGLAFGALRGVAVVLVALILLRPFAAERAWWSESVLAPPLLTLEGDLRELANAVLDAFGAERVAPLPGGGQAAAESARGAGIASQPEWPR